MLHAFDKSSRAKQLEESRLVVEEYHGDGDNKNRNSLYSRHISQANGIFLGGHNRLGESTVFRPQLLDLL
jgi:hypothetical protein